jgi:hypothetical protein
MGFSDTSRASIQMTHDANGPTVSLEEAQRIERETAEHLRKSRKLSLIVDLDQTIVHATVDPTVGEWIAEGEAWEARQAARKSPQSEGGEATTGEEDEVNPNWEALKDVKKFRLGPEALGDPRLRGMKRKGKDKSVEQEGCMYYIKPRWVAMNLVILDAQLTIPCKVLDGRNSWRIWLKSTRCTFTLWALVLMPRKCVLLLIPMARYSVVDY